MRIFYAVSISRYTLSTISPAHIKACRRSYFLSVPDETRARTWEYVDCFSSIAGIIAVNMPVRWCGFFHSYSGIGRKVGGRPATMPGIGGFISGFNFCNSRGRWFRAGRALLPPAEVIGLHSKDRCRQSSHIAERKAGRAGSPRNCDLLQ